jgi:hypothetical protein
MQILALDEAGSPKDWLDLETAINYYCRDLVAWQAGQHDFVLRGGMSRATGRQSHLCANSIIAVRGKANMVRTFDKAFGVTREGLYQRDRHMCAYCGETFPSPMLSLEHITPRSRGGKTSWTNLVSACKPCNNRKEDRTPEEANMPLLFIPYRPSRWEHFILSNRTILADQMEYLLQGVPKSSRLLAG